MDTHVAAQLGGTPPAAASSTPEAPPAAKKPLDDLVDDLDDAEVIDRQQEGRLAAEISAADVVPKRRRGKGTSPTQRTLKYLREQGCQLVAITEKWNPHAMIRQDLFGIIDVLAIKDEQVIAVQACSGGDVSKRIDKIAEAEFKNPVTQETCLTLAALLKAKIKVYVHGWRKNAKGDWELREVELS
jgi:hypothetical protein